MELNSSPTQVRSRLVQAARWIAAEHRPEPDGLCPVCRFADCQALRTAVAYLDLIDQLDEAPGGASPRMPRQAAPGPRLPGPEQEPRRGTVTAVPGW